MKGESGKNRMGGQDTGIRLCTQHVGSRGRKTEFQASLGYKASNGQVSATEQDPISKRKDRWSQSKRGNDVPREKSRNP